MNPPQPFLSRASLKACEPPLVLEPQRFRIEFELKVMAVRVLFSPPPPLLIFSFFFSLSSFFPSFLLLLVSSSFSLSCSYALQLFCLFHCYLLALAIVSTNEATTAKSSHVATVAILPTTISTKGTYRPCFSL